MDRSAAWALIAVSIVMAAVGGVGWLLESPVDSWDRLLTPDGEIGFLPRDIDQATLVHASVVEALRRAPLLCAAAILAFGIATWLVTTPDVACPVPARIYVTLAPGLVASVVSAAVFTPPDILTTLMLSAVMWAVYVPSALGLLALSSRRHARLRAARAG